VYTKSFYLFQGLYLRNAKGYRNYTVAIFKLIPRRCCQRFEKVDYLSLSVSTSD
jgi:hypothetical protein